MGDFNCSWRDSPAIQAAMAAGWVNAATIAGLEDTPTYGQSVSWDRASSGPGTSVIDYVFMNPAA
eukprot:11210508-Alexandrium_andersonii.AAC.1